MERWGGLENKINQSYSSHGIIYTFMKNKRVSRERMLKHRFDKMLSYLTNEYKVRSEYGFIYVIASVIIKTLWALNLVEWFKILFYQFCRLLHKKINQKATYNWAIDIFIVLKFLLVFLFIFLPENPVNLRIVLYLLIMNVFTYFYHHVWRKPSDNCSHWQARRFLTLMLAIAFNVLCYVYLYWNGLSRIIHWRNSAPSTFFSVLQYSLSNTFLLPCPLSVDNTFGLYLQTTQQVISFIFLVIILSQSIPQPKKEG